MLLKWAGSKRRIISQLRPLLPTTFHAYHEPFAGSAALFFALELEGKRVLLNDVNPTVAALYDLAKERPETLKHKLADMSNNYLHAIKLGGREGAKAYYDAQRVAYDALPPSAPARVAQLVFITHLCWSGMYQERRDGKCGASFGPGRGKYDTAFYFPENIDAASARLRAVDLTCSSRDFSHALRHAAAGDFVFMDPPYPGGFNAYHSSGWTDAHHQRIADAFEALTTKGCHVLLTLPNTKKVRNAYKMHKQVPLVIARTVLKNHSRVAKARELAIMNYSPT
jgi:DNA adenine methylase